MSSNLHFANIILAQLVPARPVHWLCIEFVQRVCSLHCTKCSRTHSVKCCTGCAPAGTLHFTGAGTLYTGCAPAGSVCTPVPLLHLRVLLHTCKICNAIECKLQPHFPALQIAADARCRAVRVFGQNLVNNSVKKHNSSPIEQQQPPFSGKILFPPVWCDRLPGLDPKEAQ